MSASSSSAAAAAAVADPVFIGAVALVCAASGCSFRFLFLAGDAPTFTPLMRHQQRCPHVLAELRASFEREQQEVEADKQRVAAREASLQQRQQLLGITQSPREDRKQRMDDEAKGHSVSSPLAAAQHSGPSAAAAAAAAAASPAQRTPLKRAREDGQRQRRADPASAFNSATAKDGGEEDAALSLPAAKAPRTAHSASASSAAAATSAVASASRSRIPKAATASSSSSTAAAAHSAIPLTPQPTAAAASVASLRPGLRPSVPRPAVRLGTPAAVFQSVEMPPVSVTMGAAPHLQWGEGPPLVVHQRTRDHWVCFNELFPRMVARGLLPAAPPQPLRNDDPSLSPALRMLLYYHEHHARFSQIPRIRDATDNEYRDPREWTVLADGVPFVKLCGVERTLLEQPYLTQSQYDALDDEANRLLAAIKPVREAEPIYPELHAREAKLAAARARAVNKHR